MENNEINQPEIDPSEVRQIRIEKLKQLQAQGADPYAIVKFDKTHSSKQITDNPEGFIDKDVKIAGRMISRRIMGKASFAHILDGFGTIQIYIKLDEVGETVYDGFKKADIGDIFGVEGTVFVTHKGETSVKVKKITLLAKSLLPLPEKYHGLKDPDLRYRQRYVDLIANPEVKQTFIKRSKIISAIREYLDKNDFIEVETPILNTIAGGAAAKPFVTHHNALDIDMFLRIAPELYLKRLIVGGFEKVYELGRLFRNEGMDIKHNPEFTSVELYQAYVDFVEMMNLTEKLIKFVANKVNGSSIVTFEGMDYDLSKPFNKITMLDAIKKYADVDCSGSVEDIYAQCKQKNIEIEKNLSWGKAVMSLFENYVEQNLTDPTFVCYYPVEDSPLTKKYQKDPRLTERFELFITGREIANAYSELNDPLDQKERFIAQAKARANGDEEANLPDEDFVTALEYGMPPTGGLGIGVDRLIQFLTDNYSIRDILLFPTMKPLKN